MVINPRRSPRNTETIFRFQIDPRVRVLPVCISLSHRIKPEKEKPPHKQFTIQKELLTKHPQCTQTFRLLQDLKLG